MSMPPTPCPPEFQRFMLMTAIVSIFSVSVFIIAVYYVYLRRCYNTSHPDRISRLLPFSRTGAADFFFSTCATSTGGLHKDVADSLPVFLYKPEDLREGLCCAVCLSEFQENEKAKLLPNCNHRFHVECVDMWFYSHSTCPLCRASVDNQPKVETSVELGDVSIGDQQAANYENMTLSIGEQQDLAAASSFNCEHVEEHSKSSHAIDMIK